MIKLVKKINDYEIEISELSDLELQNKTEYFKKKYQIEKIF